MSDKIYQIKNGAVTLYVDMKYNGTNFEFVGLIVEGDGNFYQPHAGINDNENVDGRPRVGLGQYLLDKFKTLADEQLKDYLDRKIGDMSIYDAHDNGFERLWRGAGRGCDVRMQKCVCCRQAIDGIIGLEVNHMICLFDLAGNRVIGYKNQYGLEDPDITPLRAFYGDHLNCLLALEQLKRGFSPPFYMELAKLNHFLSGKKSMKLVMKDGSIYEYKHHNGNEVSVYSLLKFDSRNAAEPFSLNNSYDLRPRLTGNYPVEELDYLQYGRERHYIDPDALKQFIENKLQRPEEAPNAVFL